MITTRPSCWFHGSKFNPYSVTNSENMKLYKNVYQYDKNQSSKAANRANSQNIRYIKFTLDNS